MMKAIVLFRSLGNVYGLAFLVAVTANAGLGLAQTKNIEKSKSLPTSVWPAFLGAGASPIDSNSLPLTWSPTTNLAWKTKLPGQGQSAPVIWGEKIFVTSIDGPTKDTCCLTALDLTTGKELWTYKRPSSQKVRSNYFQSRSAPTPVVDGERVYAFFETGDLVALSHSGTPEWERSLVKDYGKFESTIGLASSLTQAANGVFVLIDHEGPSYLLAVDKKTGKNLWKSTRDSRHSYTSPVVMRIGSNEQIVVSSDGTVDGYDPVTGNLLWSFDDLGGNVSGTPFPVGPGRFLVSATPGMHGEREKDAKRSNLLMTVTPSGKEFQPSVTWRVPSLPNFCNPVTHKNVAYWVNKIGTVYAYDLTTGKELFSERLKQTCWAAPFGVGERVYFFGKDGVTTVLKAGPSFELLAVNGLWEGAIENSRTPVEGSGKPTRKREKQDGEPGKGAPPAGTAKERPEAGPGGRNFADPVQYGIAAVNGSLVIRTGAVVYCVRGKN